MTQRDGVYYDMHTLGDRIALWKTTDMQRLADATPVTVWRRAPHIQPFHWDRAGRPVFAEPQ